MEITLNNFFDIAFSDVVIIATIIGLISGSITIWKFLKSFWNKSKSCLIIFVFQRNEIQHNRLAINMNNVSNQVNIIQQNNIVAYAKDNQSLTFAINKETLKNIAIFVAGIICCYLAHRAYKCLSLKNSQDCIKN